MAWFNMFVLSMILLSPCLFPFVTPFVALRFESS